MENLACALMAVWLLSEALAVVAIAMIVYQNTRK
jgi:hypothetical protein